MKRFSLLLLVATFAAVASTQAQVQDATVSSGIHRATPSPSPGAQTATAGPAKPFEASLTADAKAKSSASSVGSFPASTQKIYMHFEDDAAKKGDKIRVVWTAEDAKPYPKNKKVTENSGSLPGPNAIGSYYLPADGLPVGRYNVAVSVNDKVLKTFNFTVTK